MSLLSASLFRAASAASRLQPPSFSKILARGKNTKVRIIAVQDLPNGKAYRNDILEVAAGYARNFLIPKKFAVYATRQNFMKYELKDPELETVEERRLRLEREASQKDNLELKAADLLKNYLRNKTVRRSIFHSKSEAMHKSTIAIFTGPSHHVAFCLCWALLGNAAASCGP